MNLVNTQEIPAFQADCVAKAKISGKSLKQNEHRAGTNVHITPPVGHPWYG